MEERALRVLTLTRLQGFGPRRLASLVRVGGIDEVYEKPRRFAHLIGPVALRRLEDHSARREAERVFDQAKGKGQSVIVLDSPEYPTSLAALYDPPPVLFLRGLLRREVRRVAIVGARGATPWGRSFARDLARGLAARGIEVISGLARGIDGAAHEGALSGKGSTLAVLGSSVDIIYPGEHVDLAGRIEKSGGVLSELPPGTGPTAAQFPSRNRIIVGLSEAVVVVEAGAKSGALITARVALEEGRDVLAVPGRPADPLAFGPNLLLRDGAVLTRGTEDVLEHLGLVSTPSQAAGRAADPILEKLAHSAPKSVDQLAVDTGLAPPLLIARLSELEIDGKIERLPGTLFRSASPA
ncbi:MAG: DNA-protecting protein DprA [Vicinamibacteria bacterium]|nr:DNA-protecting protein DprA [Vicinamibacteria bacterium]